MRQHQAHEIVELGLFHDFHRYLAAGIRSADHRVCRCCFDREVAGFVLPGNLLAVNVIEPVSLDDLRDNFSWLEELEFGTGQRAQARF
ncbi:Uncharacterised protein [Enterobacter hormaechei]|nr:Uncharacterised protein [Enterobacter hormaechei]SAG20991.1 Uncharacterised protein [Enterobacter hormaechei]